MKPRRTLYLAVGLLTPFSQAFALGLGDIHISNALGQPLLAQIPLLASNNTKFPSMDCFTARLMLPEQSDSQGVLVKINFDKEKKRLDLLGKIPINEPVLMLSVQVACEHNFGRNYTLFFSPPDIRPSLGLLNAPVLARDLVETSPRAASTKPPAPPLPPIPARKAAQASKSAPLLSQAGSSNRPAKPNRDIPNSASANSSGLLRDQIRLQAPMEAIEGMEESLLIPRLQMSWHLTQPAKPGSASEELRNLLRMEYRLLQTLNERGLSQLALSEKMREMDASVNEMQRANRERAKSLQQVDSERHLPSPTASQPADRSTSIWFYLVPMLLLSIAGGFWWERRRKRLLPPSCINLKEPEVKDEARMIAPKLVSPQQQEHSPAAKVEQKEGQEIALKPPEPERPLIIPEKQETPRHPVSSFIDAPVDRSSPVFTKDSPDDEEVVPAPLPLLQFPQSVSHAPPTPLQEALLPELDLLSEPLQTSALGIAKETETLLEEQTEQQEGGEDAMRPWLNLLEVYRNAGMRGEFEKVAMLLKDRFGKGNIEWNHSSAPSVPEVCALENYPEIISAVTTHWTTANCIKTLEMIIETGKLNDGNPFPPDVVEELLFLKEVRQIRPPF